MHNKLVYMLVPFAVLMASCATSPQVNLPKLPQTVTRVYIDGASFEPPHADVWYVETHTPYKAALVTPHADINETTAVEIQLYKNPNPTSTPVSEAEYVQQVRQGEEKDTDPKRFTMQIHEVTAAKVGKAICARSYSLATDHAPHTASHNGKPMLLEISALNCLHPDDPRVGVNVSLSDRYYPGDQDPDFKATAAKMLDSVELSKLNEGKAN